MKVSSRFVYCLLFVCWLPWGVWAGVPLKSWQMTTAHGLPNNTVRSVYQDHRGRIWMGTMGGLACYDGNDVQVYDSRDAAGRDLPFGRKVRQIAEDGNHHVWILTGDGYAACFDPVRTQWVDVSGDGRCCLEANRMWVDARGDVWLTHGRRGAMWHVRTNASRIAVSFILLAKGEQVGCVHQVAGGEVYIGTSRSLLVQVPGERVPRRLLSGHDFIGLATCDSVTYWASADGKLWRTEAHGKVECVASLPVGSRVTGLAAWQEGLLVFTLGDTWSYSLADRSLGRSKDLQLPGGTVFADNRGQAWVCNGTGVLVGLPVGNEQPRVLRLLDARQLASIDRERYTVCRSHNGEIFVSAYGAGLYVYDPHTGELMRHGASGRLPLLNSDFVYEMIEDRAGNLWLGQRGAGIAHLFIMPGNVVRAATLDEGSHPAEAEIKAVAVGADGRLWVSDRSGRVGVADESGGVAWAAHVWPSPVYSLVFTADGQLLAGTRKHGLCDDSGRALAGSGEGVFALCRDSSGRIWAGTLGHGLWAYAGGRRVDPFGRTCPASEVRHLAMGADGRIWAATEAGLLVFHPDSLWRSPSAYVVHSHRNSSLGQGSLNTVFVDSQGMVWAGTAGDGLYRCCPKADGTLETIHYDTSCGLAANEVQAVIEDFDGRIWVATQYGLSGLSRGESDFSSYFLSSVPQGDMYGANAAALTGKGCLALGTSDGLALVDPMKMRRGRVSPSPIFTAFYADGVPQVLHEDSAGRFSPLMLRRGVSSATIRFSNLDYTRFRSSRYSYMLAGRDTVWSVPSDAGVAVFRDLVPGRYTLLVRSANSSGEWCARAASLSFSVPPPFYRSPWAYAAYASFGLLLGGLAVYAAARTMRLRRMVEMERELSGFKLRFFIRMIRRVCEPLSRLQEATSDRRAADELGRIRQVLQQTLTFTDRPPSEAQEDELAGWFVDDAAGAGEVCQVDEENDFNAKLQGVVSDRLSDSAFTVDAWAEALCMKRTVFYKKVKEQTGMTPNDLLRTNRLKRAAELLLDGGLNVSEVAYKVGFDDVSYFSKSFKSYFGMTPSSFRKSKS